ncbi:MAG: UvrD-helicase domain-containing protein [Verrucomicrobiae bacterium]|nr:UvrD-helicase domain-containing protein [Verrucomicrobiae bacterium]
MNTAGEPNLMIQASAGSGKTHHLVGRVLRLLRTFQEPEKIIALTFTRKAAGEFFDRILGALAIAAESDAGAARIADEQKVEGFTRDEALALLRAATDSLHALSLGTLDSFYSRVLRTFPGEFGIGADFDVLEDSEATEARREVFDRVLGDPDDAEDFLAAFRQATFGAEEKRLLSNLEKFVEEFHQLLIACPDRNRWTNAAALWPEELPWWITDFDVPAVAECLRKKSALLVSMDKRMPGGFEKLADLLPQLAGGSAGVKIDGILGKILPIADDLKHRRVSEFQYYKVFDLDPEFCEALGNSAGIVLRGEIVSKLERTKGIYDIVRRYEETYHQRVRRAGRLSFDDILILLAGAAPDFSPEDDKREEPFELSMLDDQPDAAGRRLRVDYRLDSRFNHWLIDEFQDTSRRQWQVLRNLIDEVVADDSGERSFYYVGDEKQAIYGWRGGDSRLFNEVRERYEDAPEDRRIQEADLDASWRSGPVILDAANHVFGQTDGLKSLLGPDHAPMIDERWTRAWRKHLSNRPNRPGYFKLMTLEEDSRGGGGGDDDDDGEDRWDPNEARWQIVLKTLEEIDPVGNGLSVAILMRRKKPAAALADFIRQHGDIPVIVEGEMPIGSDHPVATSFRALLQYAAHPGDSAAWEHLAMTPVLVGTSWEALNEQRYQLPASTLELLHDRGFLAVFEDWANRLRQATGGELDRFSERRISQIAEACRRFDLRGSRSIETFLTYLEGVTATDTPSAGVVQVMTIHKSKGLDFDAVILADFQRDTITSTPRLEALTGRNADREITWVMSRPKKELAKAVEPLRTAYLEAEKDAAYEELCNLYVALTRAKYANYVVTPKLPKKDSAAPHCLLVRQLEASGFEPREESVGGIEVTVRYEDGDPDWLAARLVELAADGKKESSPKEKAETPRSPVSARRRFPLRHRRIPSNSADQQTWGGAARLFVPESASATGLGSAVHALFEQLIWLDDPAADARERRWKIELAKYPEFAREARKQAEGSLAEPTIRARFERASYRSPIVWLEKRFEQITPGGEWISGVFDRVVLERDDNGKLIAGHIIDFKTNLVETGEEIDAAVAHYTSQMTVYRAALSRLTGLSESAIGAELIFTRPRVVRAVFSPGMTN